MKMMWSNACKALRSPFVLWLSRIRKSECGNQVGIACKDTMGSAPGLWSPPLQCPVSFRALSAPWCSRSSQQTLRCSWFWILCWPWPCRKDLLGMGCSLFTGGGVTYCPQCLLSCKITARALVLLLLLVTDTQCTVGIASLSSKT